MKREYGFWLLLVLLSAILAAAAFLTAAARIGNVQFAPQTFTESSRELPSIDRGFYQPRAFSIRLDPQEYPELETQNSEQPHLEQIQINLRRFAYGEISEVGLENIENLFSNLNSSNRYIIRFLYDWNGQASQTEPADLNTILTHMRQLSPILQAFSRNIFVLQGLFTGNWGEMNGTPHNKPESLRMLAAELLEDTQDVYLSVRTPLQWRIAMGQQNLTAPIPSDARIGLFNDGLTGNATDCGTFTAADAEKELAFQENLCKYVPNGGEAVLPGAYNDFETAVSHLRTLHVTYLNREYDQAVLDKWASSTVQEEGCFDGMDGLTYMDRHLGYRYLLAGADAEYSWLRNRLIVTASIRNVGFAPVYSEKPVTFTLRGNSETITLTPKGDLREAVGGNESGTLLRLSAELSVPELQDCAYDVYLQIWDPITNSPLELANEQTPEQDGFYLGKVSFDRSQYYEVIKK